MVGLLVYERLGLRLGGVLVMPLVLTYALFEPRVLPVFFLAVAGTYAAGWVIQRTTLLYGRRLLYAYILVGLVLGAVLLHVSGAGTDNVVLVVLPGIFAFNLHREGHALRSTGQFAGVLLPSYFAAHFLLFPFGFAGGLFEAMPTLHAAAGAFLSPDSVVVGFGERAAQAAADGGGIGAVLGNLLWGDGE